MNDQAKVQTIIGIVAGFYSMSIRKMLSRDRSYPVLVPRMIAIKLAREFTKLSSKALGEEFGRDHGAILNALNGAENLLGVDRYFRADFERVRVMVVEAMGEPQ